MALQPRRRNVPAAAELPVGPGRPLLFDFDNDGFLDLLPRVGRRASDALAQRRRRRLRARRRRGASRRRCDAEAVDFDGDGDLDLVARDAAGERRAPREPRAATRTAGSTSRSRAFRPGSAKVNRVRLRLGGRGQGAGPLRLPGRVPARDAPGPGRRAGRPRSCASCGPTGSRRTLSTAGASTLVREVQQLKGSCPFLYAFDGRALAVRDRRARAQPAGLLYDGVHQAPADTREWLRRPGRMLRAVRRPAAARFHRGALGGRVLRPRGAPRRGPPARRRARRQREDGPAALSAEERLFTVARPRTPRAIDGAGPRPHARRSRAEDGVFLGRLRADALPGDRRAARARARAAGGARGRRR